jgi:hypothetical protein
MATNINRLEINSMTRHSKEIVMSTEKNEMDSGPKIENESKEALQDPETAETHDQAADSVPFYETISAKELSLLSTAFTIATFMIALDGSILCK